MATFYYRPTMISSSSFSSSTTITRFRANLFTPQRQLPQHNNLPLAFPGSSLFPKALTVTSPPPFSSSSSFTSVPHWSAFRGLGTGTTSLGNAPILTRNSFDSTAAVSASPSAPITVTEGISPFFGLKWWVFIVLATLLSRLITLPVLIIEEKLRTELSPACKLLEDIKDPDTTFKVFEEMTMKREEGTLVRKQEYKVHLFKTTLIWIFHFVIFISSFIVLMRMVKKFPSFKNGGAYWFGDLSTPDPLGVFPVLSALLFVIRKEINKTETGVSIEKKRVIWMLIAFLTIPFMKWVPNAMYCYWIPYDIFTLLFDLAIKHPRVKRLFKREV